VSTKTLRIGLGSRTAPSRCDLPADVAEILGTLLGLDGALKIEDGSMEGLEDDLLSTQLKGDPVAKMQPQPIPKGLGNGDLTLTSES
jgi:hypothetical protein